MAVLYRIAHRVNYATVNLANALQRYGGYRAYHYLTHPLPHFEPEKGFFATDLGFVYRELPIEDLRTINRALAGGEAPAAGSGPWCFDDPAPDLLIINQGSGISPHIGRLFGGRARVLFYAECFTVADFYPRRDWPMPESMAALNEDYHRRAIAYAEEADAIIVPSTYARRLWPPEYQAKIHAIFEGFDVGHLAPERILGLSDYGRRFRQRFPDKKLVAYIGETIEPIRGFDSWLKAYRLLRQRRPDLHFVVVSNDRIKYGEVGKSCLNGVTSFKNWAIEAEGLAGADLSDITWLGSLPLYDYLSLLSELDVVIYPMYGMYANWSLFHALHMGTAVVASDRAYLPEVIEDGVNGFLADPDDAAALAAKAFDLLESDALRERFRVAGRRTIEQNYSLRNTADRLSGLLGTLTAA